MAKLCEMSFKEFWWSMFVEDNGEETENKGWILQSPESKIVDSSDGAFYGQDCLVSFYKKGAQRWIKKMEKSSEQLMDDCTVYLYSEDRSGLPSYFKIDCGNDSFDFVLSDRQLQWILDMVEKDFWTDHIIWKAAFER